MYINHEKYALVNGVVLDGTRDMTPRTGLAVCVELRYMTDALMLGEWFE